MKVIGISLIILFSNTAINLIAQSDTSKRKPINEYGDILPEYPGG